MPSKHLASIRLITLIALLTLSGTSCRKKAELQYQVAQARQTLTELQLRARPIEAELATVGNLGKYNNTRREHIAELKNEIEQIKQAITRLKSERADIQAQVDRMQREVDVYKAKHFIRR